MPEPEEKPLSHSTLIESTAWYAVAAGALFLPAAADAQIVYTDPPDCEATQVHPCYIDFDQDGDAEMIITKGMYGGAYGQAYYEDGLDVINAIDVDHEYRHGHAYLIFNVLPLGLQIGPMRPSMVFVDTLGFSTDYGGISYQDQFFGVGFKLYSESEEHLGWGRIYRSDYRFFIKDYAYQAIPGGSIGAGVTVQSLLLAGVAAPLSFPSSGGTLTYRATLTNTTAADTTLDVWVDAPRGTIPELLRLLDTVTLPAEGSVERSYSVEIPASAAAMNHIVTFYLGHFATGEYVTTQSFQVAKTTGTSTEAAPATHALSEVYPNPSGGRARFTLTVGATQDVRVAVYDALGREAALLHDGPLTGGAEHAFTLDPSALPSGVYVVRVLGTTFADTRVVTLLR